MSNAQNPPTVGAPDASVRLGAYHITRRFGGLIANDQIDFSARRSTVHAIVGGNGAGKSTLMRVLQGMDRPDSGFVLVDGKPVVFLGPADAFANGIGMVHQEFMLVSGLTLLENLVLGHEPIDALGRINRKDALSKARALERQAGIKLDWDMQVDDAPVHVRQIVEILRLLYRGADVLILDEPTAVLAPAQVQGLIALLKRLRDEGRTIIFISHKLDEVMSLADDITVIRAGRVIGSMSANKTSKASLAEMMIGEVVSHPVARPSIVAEVVLEISCATARNARGLVKIKDLSLIVRAGEIVGIAGIAGNGQDELISLVTGLLCADAGRISLMGTEVTKHSLAERRAIGLAYLSPDRAAEGLCLTAPIIENAIAGKQRKPGLSWCGILFPRAIEQHVKSMLDLYSVQRNNVQQPVGSLSGGNQQRVAIARELDGNPKLLVACQPTRGVDIGGSAFIHKCLLDFRSRGGAVLLISEELEEVIALSDRILVLYDGRITGVMKRGETGMEGIGRLMLGKVAA